MLIRRVLVIAGLAVLTGYAAFAAFSGAFVRTIDGSETVSLRQESTRSGHRGTFFAAYYAGRAHRGGGLSGGK